MDVSDLYGHVRHQSYVRGESSKRALLLHGFPGTPAEMNALCDLLLGLDYEVHVPLHPGLGMDIANLGTLSWPTWVDAAEKEWQGLQEGSSHTLLLGFSMGASVALSVAARTAVDNLILIAPFWRLSDMRAKLLPLLKYALPELKPFDKADFASDTIRAQFARLEPELDLDDPDVQRALREQAKLPTRAIVEVQRLGENAYKQAKYLKCPITIFQGTHDVLVTPADTRRLVTRYGGAVTLQEFAGDHQCIDPQGDGHALLFDKLGRHLDMLAHHAGRSELSP